MQIGSTALYDITAKRMSDLSAQAAAVNTQISTGSRIQQPSDDPLASARLASLKQVGADATQYGSNLTLSASLLQQSDDALGAVSTDLQRVKELALRASNDTLSDDDRQSIAAELDGIVDSMMTTANTTDSRGIPLFSGADGQVPFAKNADGSVAFQSSGTPPSIPVSATSSVAATESGARVFGAIPNGQGGTTDMFAIVKGLADTLRAGGSSDDVAASMTQIDAASDQVTNVRASVDARASRVDLESKQSDAAATERESERSALADTDVDAAVVKLQQLSTTLSATQATFSKLSQLSLFNYLS